MTNFDIIPVPGNEEDKILPSLHIRSNGKDYAIIWADNKISFQPYDYYAEEVTYLVKISSMFISFYNNLKTK